MSTFYFFYKTAHPFSQWHPSRFEVDGIVFHTAEQYMMYHKALLFGDADTAAKILAAEHPRDQKALGRAVRNFDAAVWNEQAQAIVYQGNYAKFSQNAELKKVLLETGDLELVEASPTDTIWGIGLEESDPDCLDRSKWRGTNWLGIVLMRVRAALR